MSNYKGTDKQPNNFGKYLLSYFETLRHAKNTREVDSKIISKINELKHLLSLNRNLTDDETNSYLQDLYDFGIDIEKEFNFFNFKYTDNYGSMIPKDQYNGINLKKREVWKREMVIGLKYILNLKVMLIMKHQMIQLVGN